MSRPMHLIHLSHTNWRPHHQAFTIHTPTSLPVATCQAFIMCNACIHRVIATHPPRSHYETFCAHRACIDRCSGTDLDPRRTPFKRFGNTPNTCPPSRLPFSRRSASISPAYRDTTINDAVPGAAAGRVVMCAHLSAHTLSGRQVSGRRMADQMRIKRTF
jgi:hypothetical protein